MIAVLAGVLIWGAASGNMVAAVPLDITIWLFWLYLNPFTNCRWCHGSGRHPFQTRRTYGGCFNPRCQRGTVQRAGSKTLHSAVQALKDYRRKQRGK